MAEYVATATQEVAQNGNVTFTNTAVQGGNCIKHREGSGIITLRGITNQCRARYFVDFSAEYCGSGRGNCGRNFFSNCYCRGTGSFFSNAFYASCGISV